jgi:uncharacterized RmlC-like cupin family protein
MFMSDLACIVVDVDGPYSGAQGLDYFEASRRRRRRARAVQHRLVILPGAGARPHLQEHLWD